MVEQINESAEQTLGDEVDVLIGDIDFGNFEVGDGVIWSPLSKEDWWNKDYVKNGNISYDDKWNILFDASEKWKMEEMMTDYFMSLNIDAMFANVNLKNDGRMRKLKKDLDDIQEDILDWKLELILPPNAGGSIKIWKTKNTDISNGTVFWLRKPGSTDYIMLNILFNQFTGRWYIQYDGRWKEFNNAVWENLLNALKPVSWE